MNGIGKKVLKKWTKWYVLIFGTQDSGPVLEKFMRFKEKLNI